MAKKSRSKKTHISPGIYFKETEIGYSTKSLGLTKLGLAGETVKGPAFQPITINDWTEFKSYFGGTSTEKFRGSQYPKYELPYIAQQYLKQSKNLQVVRTLGLSGVNAGPAWVITATKHNCTEGYEYEIETEADGGEGNQTTVNVTLNTDPIEKNIKKGNDGFFKKTGEGNENAIPFTFTKPNPIIKIGDNQTLPAKQIGVVDGYLNIDTDVIYVDDQIEEYFELLPKGIQGFFGSLANLKEFCNTKSSAQGDNVIKTFYYVDLDNEIKNGKIAIVSEKGENAEIKIILERDNGIYTNVYSPTNRAEIKNAMKNGKIFKWTDNNETADRTDDDIDHYFIMIPSETLKIGEENDEEDIVVSNIKCYQYGFTWNDYDKPTITETGKIFSYKRNEVAKQVCVEDISSEFNNMVVAVLRSRGEHKKATPNGVDECGNTVYNYDGIEYYAKNVELKPSNSLILGDDCHPGYNTITGDFNVNSANYGKFNIAVDSVAGCEICGVDTFVKHVYAVSLNPSDKNYITKVLGTNPEVGTADLYVEELYDVALEQLIYEGEINAINHELAYYPAVNILPKHEPITDLLTKDASNLTKRDLGKRYLYSWVESQRNNLQVRISKDEGITWEETDGIIGHIYTVMSTTNTETGKKEYFYGEYRNSDGGLATGEKKFTEYLTFYNYSRDVVKNDYILHNCVKNMADGCYYIYSDYDDSDTANEGDVIPITLDYNNYKEEYRYASTPWIVSEVKGSGEKINLHKLFRFHTISDGNASNTEVKVSIENIDPENETFDVVVRSFYDSDNNPNVLERFGKCTLQPGTSGYIGLKIGTIDNVYTSQSTYITVEINEDDITYSSIPCGFLGYPVRNYNGVGIFSLKEGNRLSTPIKQPYLRFNTTIDEDISVKKQYFGMSDLVGIDEDVLSYKGVEAYNEDPDYLTPCFHLDARILNGEPTGQENGLWYVESETRGVKQVVEVDGVSGYIWSTVSKSLTTDAGIEPRIGTSDIMENTIYEEKSYRKFTLCFYGGWDGWDYYRTHRSNTDEYRYNKYKGKMNKISGQGSMFNVVKNPEVYGFDGEEKVITSDYYAYLAAVKQLENPMSVSINLLATPGIDNVNQKSLVNEVINIAQESRGDVLYVMSTPDKPFGAGDSKSEMYTPMEVVANLEDSEIDSNYVCTYYPWCKYYDQDNSQYIYLPVTLDVVRNMAETDNIAFPWYSAAGWNRGNISGSEPKRKLKRAEEDTLYESHVNYVKSFAQEGDKIWGDYTLQTGEHIMNHISKRRLLIYLKNKLSNACVDLIFDPNDNTMARTFEERLKSTMESVKKDRGIVDYRVTVENTPETQDQLRLNGKVYFKPTPMVEFIEIELAATPLGVQWQ